MHKAAVDLIQNIWIDVDQNTLDESDVPLPWGGEIKYGLAVNVLRIDNLAQFFCSLGVDLDRAEIHLGMQKLERLDIHPDIGAKFDAAAASRSLCKCLAEELQIGC